MSTLLLLIADCFQINMTPHANFFHYPVRRRLWWSQPMTMTQRLIIYYNTYITPVRNSYSIRRLTKHDLAKIFFHLETLHIFDEVNHFVTEDRMFRIDNECELVVTCKNCSDKEILKNPMLGNRMYLMEGNQHFTLPQSMLYSLLEMVALWCDICKIKNFVWYTDSDCISCTLVN